ncbi:YceI family protein [Aquisalimonas lutea]|uniref:YceI family protein n=1 Tax=Aquisalimonas lutea TaxID=1327750 RepID=UPI0025B4F9D5|nr:YceI family protein [Aquisalimonas lutea]MDN3518882.1 YceI family protein [Aquisalimonas lutea]
MRKLIIATTSALSLSLVAGIAQAEPEQYELDPRHSFIEFRVSHLGFATMVGQFNDFDGEFTYDPDNPSNSEVSVTIDTASIDTDDSERDRHLRNEDFLNVSEYPEARFVSTSFEEHGDGEATLEGELTLHGTTRPITIDVNQLGAGEDPWGGYRRGFEGTVTLDRSDFGIDYDLGEEAEEVELYLSVEGVRQD